MLNSNFLMTFKSATELIWRDRSINPRVYGFQFQPGTRWNPGMSENKIAEFEDVLGTKFSHDFRALLRTMNGTDLPTLNVYGACGQPSRQGPGVYSYPKDLEIVRRLAQDVSNNRTELRATMAEQGFVLQPAAALVPIFAHRYLVCTPNLDTSVVLSVHNFDDAIVYGQSLREYLEKEFLAA